jgi:hypothetical protein
MEKEIKKLHKLYGDYLTQIGVIESKLSDKIDFEFSLDYMPGDGFLILDVESDTKVAPLEDCLKIIKKKGILTSKDLATISI